MSEAMRAGKRPPWANSITHYGEEAPEQLLAHPLNPKLHPRAQQEALEGAINELGWIAPVVVNSVTNHVIDGHARIGLAISRREASVPVAYVRLTPEQEQLALVTFDPIGAMAATDKANLEELLKDVQTDDAALRTALRDLADDNGLAWGGDPPPGEAPEAEVDRAEELRDKWGTREGQLWVVGRHRLLCGDCRNPDDMRRLCAEKVQGVFTSPPYAEQRKEQYGGVSVVEYVDWWEAVQANIRGVLTPDGSFFLNMKGHTEAGERVLYVLDLVLTMKRRWGWRYVDELCWVHHSIPGQFVGRFKNGWEPVYHFTAASEYRFRPQHVVQPFKGDPADLSVYDAAVNPHLGGRYSGTANGKDFSVRSKHFDGALPSNVLHVETGMLSGADGGHGAVFPPGLPAFFVQAFSDPGDIWLDPFVGSGTTMAAAHQHDRVAYGMELEPKYVAVTLERLSRMGLTPRLEDGG